MDDQRCTLGSSRNLENKENQNSNKLISQIGKHFIINTFSLLFLYHIYNFFKLLKKVHSINLIFNDYVHHFCRNP